MLRPDIEVTTADQILPLVKSNLGIGIVPEAFVEQELGALGKLYEPSNDTGIINNRTEKENVVNGVDVMKTGKTSPCGIYRLTMEKPLPQRSICLIKRINSPLSVAARELERMLIG